MSPQHLHLTPPRQIDPDEPQAALCAASEEAMRRVDATREQYFANVRRDIALAAGEWAA